MTAPLWTAQEAAHASGGRCPGDWQAEGITIDSRLVNKGDLFIALKGPNFDGHDFAAKALGEGAVAAMIAANHCQGLAEDKSLVVEDTLQGLWALGKAARERCAAKMIAVTGSVGKTGTKEALRHCLSAQAATSASLASLNNHWGVPLSLARMPAATQYGVFELGMNHSGEIRELTGLVRPHIALITNVEPAHIGNFASLTEIADAKAEIFEGLEPGGVALLNRDHDFFEYLRDRALAAGAARVVTFGHHADADARLIASHSTRHSKKEGSEVRAIVLGQEITYFVAAPGRHWVINSLAVLTAVVLAGGDLDKAGEAMATFTPPRGRGAQSTIVLSKGSFLLIDDSYNANPTSMAAALDVLAASQPDRGGRRIAVLGDMLELGEEADHHHRTLAPAIKEAADKAYLCGPHMAALADELNGQLQVTHSTDSQGLAPSLVSDLRDGDVILVKGSLGSRMRVIIEALERTAATLGGDDHAL